MASKRKKIERNNSNHIENPFWRTQQGTLSVNFHKSDTPQQEVLIYQKGVTALCFKVAVPINVCECLAQLVPDRYQTEPGVPFLAVWTC